MLNLAGNRTIMYANGTNDFHAFHHYYLYVMSHTKGFPNHKSLTGFFRPDFMLGLPAKTVGLQWKRIRSAPAILLLFLMKNLKIARMERMTTSFRWLFSSWSLLQRLLLFICSHACSWLCARGIRDHPCQSSQPSTTLIATQIQNCRSLFTFSSD